ncbi:SKP1-like protein 9 [Dichanthelium oligosanthes]|uniref:SKP1-like protein n=1 Tax=Dichanthelium oligosanthes TaxID=888268 RepID=A0A1E5VDR7_9POAL|nr:SKP1-like protein 9 [Dichanthelium oligosanthes]
MMDEAGGDVAGAGIPLPNVDARTLGMVLEYCNKHAPASAASPNAATAAVLAADKDLESFDKELVNVDTSTLFYLVNAASYLKVTGLVDLASQTVADMIKGKPVEEMRRVLGITDSGFTTEEEAAISRQNPWAFK